MPDGSDHEEGGGIFLNNPRKSLAVRVPLEEGAEARDRALKKVVRSIVGGVWDTLSDDQVTVRMISGALTNMLFLLHGEPTAEPAAGSAGHDVLARVYGVNSEVLIDRERDNALLAELSVTGFGPTYHGRFENGRLEGYIQARELKANELGLPDISTFIASEMARLHKLRPGGEESVASAGITFETNGSILLKRWLELAKEVSFPDDSTKADALLKLNLGSLGAQAEWLEASLMGKSHGQHPLEPSSDATSPSNSSASSDGDVCVSSSPSAKAFLREVVFCHQDLLGGNILWSEGWTRVQFIDFEYSGYNNRGFDFGNHFCEHAGFDGDYEKGYPSKEVQTRFIEAYLNTACPQMLSSTSNGNDNGSDGDNDRRRAELLEELRTGVNQWAVLSHIFWAVWAVVQARHSLIDFDFLAYADMRMAGYRLHKKLFFGKDLSDVTVADDV